ncbi:MAG: hypothetical protein ISQ23_02085 [Alphaproteobacteria bacterium]|nr:hypothetical protein [Alphaproteobacteria bacterium]MBL6776278.1 hypothetical protein [Alphaproteobacteria bacterium]
MRYIPVSWDALRALLVGHFQGIGEDRLASQKQSNDEGRPSSATPHILV